MTDIPDEQSVRMPLVEGVPVVVQSPRPATRAHSAIEWLRTVGLAFAFITLLGLVYYDLQRSEDWRAHAAHNHLVICENQQEIMLNQRRILVQLGGNPPPLVSAECQRITP